MRLHVVGADEARMRDGIRNINRKYRRRKRWIRIRTWAIALAIVALMIAVSARAGA